MTRLRDVNRQYSPYKGEIVGITGVFARTFLTGMEMDGGSTLPTLEELVAMHFDKLHRFAFRLTGSTADAEDLVQETFLAAQRYLPTLREPKAAFAWLLKILYRCRRRLERPLPSAEDAELDQIPERAVDAGLSDEVDPERLAEVLATMPEEHRAPLLLFYFEELRYREIAEILQVPIGTVMSRLSRAKAHLRQQLAPASWSVRHSV